MDVLILGASARAAAQSARRAGLVPAAIDLFADTDLTAIASRTRRLDLDRYPHDLPVLAATFPPGPFLYTGGLENHPDILAAIARDRPLWGVDPGTVAAVRNPFRVRNALRHAGLPTAEVCASAAHLPRDGSWLIKPLRSAGGLHIRPLDPETPPVPDDGSFYYQERLAGRALGALFLGTATHVELIGVTESRQGAPGAPFAYAGSVGPIPLTPTLHDRITAIGHTLWTTFALRGLFGIDLIERDDLPIPIEINPRYTASVEIHERATARALLDDHRLAFAPSPLEGEGRGGGYPLDSANPSTLPPSAPLVGKAILYATSPIQFPHNFPNTTHFADLPAPGTPIAPGEPILTVFATGHSLAATQRRLDRLTHATHRRIRKLGEPFLPESRTM